MSIVRKSVTYQVLNFLFSWEDRHIPLHLVPISWWRGALWGTQYRNAPRKIGKHQNTVLKIDEISILHLDPFIVGHVYLNGIVQNSSLHV